MLHLVAGKIHSKHALTSMQGQTFIIGASQDLMIFFGFAFYIIAWDYFLIELLMSVTFATS